MTRAPQSAGACGVLGLLAALGFAEPSSAETSPVPAAVPEHAEAAPGGAEPPAAPERPAATAAPPSFSPPPNARPSIDLRRPEPPPPYTEGEPAEGAGAFFAGAGWFDFASLNRHLRANGYARVASPVALLGGEGRAVMPSGFILGARGAAILTSERGGPDGLERTFGGGFGAVELGFALVRARPLLVSLTGSVGGYGIELGVGDGQSESFDRALQNPRRSTALSRGGLLTGLAFGVDGRVPIGERDARGGRGFFTLGARLGVLYGPPLGGWTLAHGGKATDGPDSGLTGFYAALALGFGGGRDGRAQR